MLDSIQALLDEFPEGVIQLQDGIVVSVSGAARRYLPQLEPGGPLPEWVALPRYAEKGSGVFTAGRAAYSYSCFSRGGEQLILFCPAPQTALTNRQLDGVLRQLRTLAGEILAEVGPATTDPAGRVAAADFSKSFHRLFRLMDNLEYMNQAATMGEDSCRLITMDLAGLCRDIVDRAYPLLREAGIALEYESVQASLLIPGVPNLLRRLLLELISNAAQAVGEGRVVLALRRSGPHALLTVSDNGPLPDPRQLAGLSQPGGGEEIPMPGQGAGLGLSIVRHIVRLHHGNMLTELGQSTPTVMISLPTGPLPDRVRVHSATYIQTFQADGGLNPVLMELSDVLPAHLFGMEGLD